MQLSVGKHLLSILMLPTKKNMSLQLNLKIVRCNKFPILSSGVLEWTTTNAILKRLEFFDKDIQVHSENILDGTHRLLCENIETGIFKL